MAARPIADRSPWLPSRAATFRARSDGDRPRGRSGFAGERELGGSEGEGSQSVCKRHCFDVEAYGAVRNSKKKPRSRCCQGRKLAANSQACEMPASPAPRRAVVPGLALRAPLSEGEV